MPVPFSVECFTAMLTSFAGQFRAARSGCMWSPREHPALQETFKAASPGKHLNRSWNRDAGTVEPGWLPYRSDDDAAAAWLGSDRGISGGLLSSQLAEPVSGRAPSIDILSRHFGGGNQEPIQRNRKCSEDDHTACK